MKHILTYCIAILALLSCVKQEQPGGASSDVITFAPYVPQTKAGFIMDNDDFSADGNKMIVYDYIRANPNTPTEGASGWYMEGVSLECDENGAWSYTGTDEGKEFLWIDQSENTFFGWLDMKDDNWYGNDVRPSFNPGKRTLSVPSITFEKDSPVHDFMYSNVLTRYYEKSPADGSVPSAEVPLEMRHLFSAIAFGVKNSTNSNVVVKSFSVKDLCSTNSAVIDFANNAAVTYGAGTRSTDVYVAKNSTDLTVGPGIRYANVFNASATAPEYMIMWPHNGTGNQWLHSTATITTDPNTGEMSYPDSYLMYVEYTMDGAEFKKRINFPKGTVWEPGKRYHYNIEFADKIIKLTCTVNAWNGSDLNIDFANSAVSMKEGKTLIWDAAKSNIVGTNVYITNNTPAEGTFHFDTPVGGNWYASLSGDVDAFILEPNTGAINETASKIRVVPVHTGDRDRDYKVTLEFFVRRSDGRTIAADTYIQPVKYTIVHQSNKH